MTVLDNVTRFGRRALASARRRTGTTPPTPDRTGFYAAGEPVPGPRGEVLAAERLALDPAVPGGATGWRVRYRTVDSTGAPRAASAAVAAPAGAASGDRRPVVVWVHGAVGVCAGCGPSRDGLGAWYQDTLLAAGVVVVAPDLTGLGVDGPLHPYMHGTTAAESVLDAARAVGGLPAAGAGAVVALVGHSAGGYAVLRANELAATPDHADLDVRLAVPMSPVGDLRMAMDHYATSIGTAAFPVQLAATWPAIEPVVAGEALTPDALERLDVLTTRRLAGLQRVFDGPATRWLRPQAFAGDAWAAALDRESAGRRLGAAPVHFVHGDRDDDARCEWTQALQASMAAAGHDATLRIHHGTDHMGVHDASRADVVEDVLSAVGLS